MKAPHLTSGKSASSGSNTMETNPSSAGAADRFYWVSVLAVTLLTLIVHVWGAIQPRGPFWGVHHYAFFPPVVLISGLGAVLLGSILSYRFSDSRERTRTPSAGPEILEGWKVTLAGLALGLVGLFFFWSFRAGNLFLGDGFAIVGSIPQGSGFHPYEPLSIALLEFVYQTVGPLMESGGPSYAPAWRAAALASAFAGAAFVPILYGLSRELCCLGPLGSVRWANSGVLVALVFLGLLAQGYVQLFFGYVEVYGLLTVGIAGYLWAALRNLRGALPLWVPSLVLALTIALHLSAALLAPSLLVLIIRSFVNPEKRVVAVRDLALSTGAFAAVAAGLMALGDGYNLFSTLWQTGVKALSREQELIGGYFLSSAHVRDFLNGQLLIGPISFLFFLPVTVWSVVHWREIRIPGAFLLVAGGSYLGAMVLAGDSNLGYARNWDLLAPGALVMSVSAIGLMSLQMHRLVVFQRVVAVCLVVSLFHTVPWVAVNASPDRALERFVTLPLGLGRVESTVGYWFAIQEKFEVAEAWLQKSLRENPANVRAYYVLGDIYRYQNRLESASRAYAGALVYRPDIRDIRLKRIDVSIRGGELEVAAQDLEYILDSDPDAHEYWAMYGLVLLEMGRQQEGVSALHRAIRLAPEEGFYQSCLEESTPPDSTRHRLLSYCTALLPS